MPYPPTMPTSPSRTAHRHGRTGFSLLELAIVVTILSIVSVLGLEVATTFIAAKSYDTTKARLEKVDEAIRGFYWVYGRLPCPGLHTVPSSDIAAYGLEDCSFVDPSVEGWGIIAGSIPFRTLNISPSLALDAYGNRITYYVASWYAVNDYKLGFGISANTGIIEVRTGRLDDFCVTDCSVITTEAIYALISHGADKRGAINRDGATPVACADAVTSRIDAQNCALLQGFITGGSFPTLSASVSTNVIYDSRYNPGSVEANHFDDIVLWRVRGQL